MNSADVTHLIITLLISDISGVISFWGLANKHTCLKMGPIEGRS